LLQYCCFIVKNEKKKQWFAKTAVGSWRADTEQACVVTVVNSCDEKNFCVVFGCRQTEQVLCVVRTFSICWTRTINSSFVELSSAAVDILWTFHAAIMTVFLLWIADNFQHQSFEFPALWHAVLSLARKIAANWSIIRWPLCESNICTRAVFVSALFLHVVPPKTRAHYSRQSSSCRIMCFMLLDVHKYNFYWKWLTYPLFLSAPPLGICPLPHWGTVVLQTSGSGTNLKVGERAKRRQKIVMPLHFWLYR